MICRYIQFNWRYLQIDGICRYLSSCGGDGGPADLKKTLSKVMITGVTPVCLYGTETLTLTELQQQRLQVCETNWVRTIARVPRADWRRMVELREETVMQSSFTEKLARSRLQLARHVERMADDRLTKRVRQSYVSRAG